MPKRDKSSITVFMFPAGDTESDVKPEAEALIAFARSLDSSGITHSDFELKESGSWVKLLASPMDFGFTGPPSASVKK